LILIATLELPAEASGIITLKAEEGDAVAVGAVVCLIDTAAKPEGSVWQRQCQGSSTKARSSKRTGSTQSGGTSSNYASGTPSPAAEKILLEKNIVQL
jgi:2-oxoglutarate dehydrogenase E2 component (dihydrolipoamide succinyltransferase)